jgi:hypothetical protein
MTAMVQTRPNQITILPEHCQVLDPDYLELASVARPVTISVKAHDDYFLRTRKLWRKRLLAAHPDKHMQSKVAQHRANEQYLTVKDGYRAWLQGEQAWYQVVKLGLPR